MRFLFGLITGAIVTLLVATAMNAPTGQIVNQLIDVWQQATAQLGETGRRAEPSQAALDPLPTGAAPPAAEATQTAATADQTDAPVATEALPMPQTFTEAVSAEPLDAVEQVAPIPAEAPLEHAMVAGQAVVWAPFHSEASAQGFASRLSQQLARPFHVKKQGAANYLVVYDYADEAERSALELQIAYATGQGAP